jgi:hypothetical protein
VRELLAENIVFNSPILARPIEGREVTAAIFAQSSSTRGSGTYTAEVKLDERTTFLRWVGTIAKPTRCQEFWHSGALEMYFCTSTESAFSPKWHLTASDLIPVISSQNAVC